MYVSKTDALERLKEDFKDNPEILENLTSNPLPASFEIALEDPQTVDTVAARFDGDPIVDEVRYGKEIADKLFAFTSQTRNFMLIFIVLLGIVAILLISNTIRLSIFARKREVEIMKLVGATNWFIRWPFVIEGVTVGLVGSSGGRGGGPGSERLPRGQDKGQPTFHGRSARCCPVCLGHRHPARSGYRYRGRWFGHRAPSLPQSLTRRLPIAEQPKSTVR